MATPRHTASTATTQPVRVAPPARRRREALPWLKYGVFLGGLIPLAGIGVRALRGALGANPIAQVENELGLLALIFLLAALACTPAKHVLGWTWPNRIRRELGLFAAFYAVLHVTVYVALDQFYNLPAILADIAQRPFITVGFLALVLMMPLALTSTDRWVRRLSFPRWKLLHRLVYLAGALAIIHFVWRVKIDVSQPLTYGAVLAILLAIRVGFWVRKRFWGGRRDRSRTGRA